MTTEGIAKARNLLCEKLKAGHVEVSQIRQAAKHAGITKSELKAARQELGVKLFTQPDGTMFWG